MNLKLKNFCIWSGSILLTLYVLFLLLPYMITPIVSRYSKDIEDAIAKSTSIKTELCGFSVVTSPNLSAGIKFKNINAYMPNADTPFLSAEDATVRISLLPLLFRQIQLDTVSASEFNAALDVKNDGKFLIQDYIPQSEPTQEEAFVLPYGFKLSNHLPNIKSKSYKVSFVDLETSKSYYTEGENFKLTDFVLDKKFKLSTKGKIVLDNNVASNYNLKIYNKIMPNLQLNDIVFPSEKQVLDNSEEDKKLNDNQFNILDVLKVAKLNNFHSDLSADIVTSGTLKSPHFKGYIKTDAISVNVDGKKLPESYIYLTFKGNRTDIDSMFFSSEDTESESTQIIGDIHTGKKPAIDLTLRSNAKFNNIIKLINSIASSFGIDDFSTLSATGQIDADFNINSDMKTVTSTGYLKILPASVYYGLYKLSIDNIVADIDLMNNNINIKKSGFSILGHPLKLTGTIGHDASLDLALVADKLSLKGLLAAFGQLALLKDNDINSGHVSINSKILGKLNCIKPEISASVNDVNVFNKSSNLKVALKDTIVTMLYDGKSASGDVDVNNLSLVHPSATVSVPKAKVLVDEKDINIKNTYMLFDNSRVDISGKVADYIQDKMTMNIKASGKLNSSDIASVLPVEFRNLITYKGVLPLNMNLTGNSKVQYIKLNVNADKDNYVSFIDADVLKNQKTKVHSSIEIIGDALSFSNTGISNEKTTIAKLTGGVSKLYSKPQLNLNLAIPETISFPIWGVPTSNITTNGSVSILGDLINPQVRGTVNIMDMSIKNMDFKISDLVADLSGYILNGSATARQFRFGGILADDISATFALKNYSLFELNDIAAKAFDGNVKGNFTYDIPTSKITVSMNGTNLNSTKAIDGAVGIKNALTGDLSFNADLAMQGLTDKEIIQSMTGDIDFNIDDGRFVSIGKLENLVAAQNVSSNSILKSAISALSTLSTVQESNKYKYIKGEMTMSGGNANISKILVSGPYMAYYVNGIYNILSNSATLTILGRLEAKVVSCLGPLGELSADKLLSYIPKFGVFTSNILKQLTADPNSENIALIPQLSDGSTSYKDFKVIFRGPVGSSSSVKSFKWLSTCDTSQMNIKNDLQNAKDAVKTNINDKVEAAKTNAQNVKTNVNNIIETQKSKVEQIKEEVQQSKTDFQSAKENAKQNTENLKNLLKNAVKNSQKKMPETSEPASESVEVSE